MFGLLGSTTVCRKGGEIEMTRQDKTALSGKGRGRITREEVTSKDDISSEWGGRILVSLLRVGKTYLRSLI